MAGVPESGGNNSAEEAHKSASWKVGRQKPLVFHPDNTGKGFRRKVSTADRSFHRGGPSGGRPVPGEKYVWPCCDWRWAMCFDAGTRGVGRIQLLNHRGLHKIRLASGGEELADFTQREIDNFRARLVDQRFRGTDHQFDIAAAG